MNEYKFIAIGASLGGIDAIKRLLTFFPVDFCIPVAVVLHRIPENSDNLEKYLQKNCRIKISDVEDKDYIKAGSIYIAPADYHLLVDSKYFSLSTEAPVNSARPSIDVLFESAADIYMEKMIAVVLTSSSRDGVAGARKVKKYGGMVIVQSPESSYSKILSSAVIEEAGADKIMNIDEIGAFLVQLEYHKIEGDKN